jgi:(S)-2-hydroxyglutarate dehydrogenase
VSPRNESPPAECDLVVVGGGIVGLAVARELLRRRPIIRLCLLEGEKRLASHQTGHTSGVIHAGIYYEPGSMKARLCVEGARELYEYCTQNGVRHERRGKLIVATSEEELPRLDELQRRAAANGVSDVARLEGSQIPEVEPHARGLAALHSPGTGIVDFTAVSAALADEVERSAGGTIHTGCRVTDSFTTEGRLVIRYQGGLVRASAGIFCAGLWADRLAIAAGAPADPRIVPFRGAFVRLQPGRAHLVRSSIYPVPDPELPFLGTHLTRGIDGQVLIGPSALLAPARDAYRLSRVRPGDIAETLRWPGTWRLARRHWRSGLAELRAAIGRRSLTMAAARLVPELRRTDTRRGPAGIRAQALGADGKLVDDFVVHVTERAVHVRNAPSPAATSALPLARLIADQLESLR